MLENDQAITCEMLVEGYTVADATKEIGEHSLAVPGAAAPAGPRVQFDQIEGTVRGERSSTTIASPSTTHVIRRPYRRAAPSNRIRTKIPSKKVIIRGVRRLAACFGKTQTSVN
jgi:hypothetical protein